MHLRFGGYFSPENLQEKYFQKQEFKKYILSRRYICGTNCICTSACISTEE